MIRHSQCLVYLLLDLTAFIQRKTHLKVGTIINILFPFFLLICGSLYKVYICF